MFYKPFPNTVLLANGLLDYQVLHFAYLSYLILDEPSSLTVIVESQPSAASLQALNKLAPNTSFLLIDLSKHWINAPWLKLLRLVLVSPPAFLLSLLTNRTSLLNLSLPWTISQVMHGIWDSSLRYSSVSTITPTLAQKLIAALSNLSHYCKAFHLSNLFRPSLIFLGHSVYSGRSSLAYYRSLPIPVYVHSYHTLNKVSHDLDSSLFTLTPEESKALLKIASNIDPQPFWSRRLSGHSSYYDVKKSFDGIDPLPSTPVNVIYLHIFKDSPFNHIDRTRIFADYFQWTHHTLSILAKSKESWLIKTHPTSSRWGENSLTILNNLIKKVFPKGLPPHILIDECTISNASLLAHARRVVTFSGSVHLEAAAHSIKPIVISSSLLETLSPSLVHKPISINDYQSLLLSPSTSSNFQLSSDDTYLSRQILQLKENDLTYGDDYKVLPLYPSDSPEHKAHVLQTFINSFLDKQPLTRKLALYLANGLTRTTAHSILDTFYSLMTGTFSPTSLGRSS